MIGYPELLGYQCELGLVCRLVYYGQVSHSQLGGLDVIWGWDLWLLVGSAVCFSVAKCDNMGGKRIS